MAKNYEIHVISNTHWDREWLFNFQETRMQLVEFFDGLLDILDRQPAYKAFLLDSQTVPLEDYLEIRPEQRSRLANHVASGRLHVGPWYTAPECFCVGGESLVRNLLYGHRVAREFGGVLKVGYTPFSYGQNSQMPQIYRGFGIDTMLFYHGVSHDDTPNEFVFEGADGSQVLASQMSSFARYNFYFHVYRPVKYGKELEDRLYDWREGGCPFHLCSETHAPDHHILLDPRHSFARKDVAERVRRLRQLEAQVATTRFLAFMMGHDSSVPDLLTLEIIEEAQKHLKQDRIFHSSLPDYMEKVKQAAKNLPVLKGERRVPKPMPLILHLYSDVISSRTRMKRLNALAEMDLQRWAEPIATLAWQFGAEYPAPFLDLAWKTLLQCHAHDSIAGSGVDDIEQDVVYRLRQVLNLSGGIKRRSLQHLQARIDNGAEAPGAVLVTVFNPSPWPRTEVITAVLDLPESSGIGQFSLRDVARKTFVPVQFVSRKPHQAVVNHAGDATAMMNAERVIIRFEARDVPAMGYSTYRVETQDVSGHGEASTIVCGHNTMENEHLRVQIEDKGTLTVTHKPTGTTFSRLHYFGDSGEAGMAWMHLTPAHDEVISSLGCPVTVSLEENGPLLARYRIEYHLSAPVGLEENGGNPWQRLDGVGNTARRSRVKRDLLITSYATLRKGSRSLEITTRLTNTAESHRLRVKFPTRLAADACHAETAFDVVERPIEFSPDSPWRGSKGVTFPMQGFVDVSDGKVGLAVVNDGLREYEVTSDEDRAIAITLLRAYEVALTTVSKRWDRHPEMKGAQALGEHEFRYLIYPHAGKWDSSEIYDEIERLRVPLEPAQTGRHSGNLPRRFSFMRLEGRCIVLSALKRSEDGHSLVVRVFNPTATAHRAKLTFSRKVRSAKFVSLEELPERELPISGKSVVFQAGSKKIVTLAIDLVGAGAKH